MPPPSLAFFNGTQRDAAEVNVGSNLAEQNKSHANDSDNDKDLLIQQLRNKNAELLVNYAKLAGEHEQLRKQMDQYLMSVDVFYKQSLTLRSAVSGSHIGNAQTSTQPTSEPDLGKQGLALKPF